MTANRKTILVAGATGNQGGGVVRHCLANGYRVVALVRNPDSPKSLALQQLGAELVQGDYNDIESIRSALKMDVNAVFLTEAQSMDPAADFHRTTNIVTAAKETPGVSTLFVSTASKTGEHETFPRWGPDYPMRAYWLQKQAIEDLVRNAGFDHWTIIRPGHFLQNFNYPLNQLTFPGFIKDLTMRVAYKPDTKVAWFDASDVGVLVADALSKPAQYDGRAIEMATEALTTDELAEKMTKALGSAVKVHYYTPEEEAEVAQVSPCPAAQKWTNEVPGEGAAEAAKHFTLTSVEDFFKKSRASIFSGA